MQKWEYLVAVAYPKMIVVNGEGTSIRGDQRLGVECSAEWLNTLKILGEQGWELAGVQGPVYTFKRPQQ